MHLRRLLIAFVSVCVVQTVAPTTTNAQSFFSFLWEGGSREIVSFDPRQTPGQIIVSFGDRRLYWVQRRGVAVSYPIAVPREQSRWQGVTSVSDKRVNPSWTPQRKCGAGTRACPCTSWEDTP